MVGLILPNDACSSLRKMFACFSVLGKNFDSLPYFRTFCQKMAGFGAMLRKKKALETWGVFKQVLKARRKHSQQAL
jgi:hypothetical protein